MFQETIESAIRKAPLTFISVVLSVIVAFFSNLGVSLLMTLTIMFLGFYEIGLSEVRKLMKEYNEHKKEGDKYGV